MKTQFTAGPWEYDAEALAIYSPLFGNGIPICIVGKNNHANAHLLEVAPELFSLLHDAIDFIGEHFELGKKGILECNGKQFNVDNARAAIAKATQS